ncbi:MAG: dihydrodipicolinate synthase family protein [Candidatus Limiplasma sp.]|nr:dihydrodipicolinate synthase family protein [Candidatus Limiplasma sp.]
MNLSRFKGVFPAFLACYDEAGEVSMDRTRALAEYCMEKGADGLYITGSSGEFVYQSVEERKLITKCVMETVGGRIPVIVHVAANSTRDSVELAKYARDCGADALASVPPYYFSMGPEGIMAYWNAIIEAAQLPFILYNIPGATNVSISQNIFTKMLENKHVIGIKNTTLPVIDILKFKACGGDQCVVFNGADEQFVAGRLMGADGGIGSTYSAMLPLFVEANRLADTGDFVRAGEIQKFITTKILDMLQFKASIIASVKTLVQMLTGLETGAVRAPLVDNDATEREILRGIATEIIEMTHKYCA